MRLGAVCFELQDILETHTKNPKRTDPTCRLASIEVTKLAMNLMIVLTQSSSYFLSHDRHFHIFLN